MVMEVTGASELEQSEDTWVSLVELRFCNNIVQESKNFMISLNEILEQINTDFAESDV